MIKFTLKCNNDHQFESWFQSTNAYDKLKASGLVICTTCGTSEVEKAIMAPSVQASRSKSVISAKERPLSRPGGRTEQALAEWKKHIEDTSDYVGLNFATEARDMHDGLTPARAIHGEAKAEDAKKLIEDGVPVLPLPFTPGRKTN